jgi:hypothetical protein
MAALAMEKAELVSCKMPGTRFCGKGKKPEKKLKKI